jgi:hypothetical protein
MADRLLEIPTVQMLPLMKLWPRNYSKWRKML